MIFTLGIFIDLSKAFDTVDPHILLQKLKSYKSYKYYDWFKSYLSNRRQFIGLNDQSILQVPNQQNISSIAKDC